MTDCAPKWIACSRRRACARKASSTSTHVADLLAAHRSGRANNAKPLWALIVLQYWIENWAKAN